MYCWILQYICKEDLKYILSVILKHITVKIIVKYFTHCINYITNFK